jgi:hypothetical protein
VVRKVTSTVRGTLTAGLQATMDTRVYDGDPQSAAGSRSTT